MSRKVFANGREITAQASSNECNGAMPDVCLSPPAPPAGPIPIPYPNFSKASDLTDGSKTVLIGGKPVCLKDQSSFKKSQGDEAATRNFGMGVVSHKIQGATFHKAWSFDVKFEGKNVCRHMDMTSHNHGSPLNTAINIDVGKEMGPGGPDAQDCQELKEKNKRQRRRFKYAKRSWICRSDKKVLNGNSALAHAKFSGADGSFGLKGFSNKLAKKYDNSFVAGRSMRKRRKGESHLCKEATDGENGFRYYPGLECQHSGHAEARIIETALKATKGGTQGGTLLLAIDWRTRGATQCFPCPHCESLLCAAQRCGLKVAICSKEGKPEPLEC